MMDPIVQSKSFPDPQAGDDAPAARCDDRDFGTPRWQLG
jgi:hypothetical protein